MNANKEWGEAVKPNGFEEALFGVGGADFLNSILLSAIRVHSRFQMLSSGSFPWIDLPDTLSA